MEFEWDEHKSASTRARRGFGFDYVVRVFLDPERIDRVDDRRDYGEIRYQTIGRIGDRVFMIAYTVRGKRIRIISARRAHDHEERTYRQGQTQR
ncbi:MAG: BrnT family toxin [Alphaproteobacteria bacterium]|nr:BrnT family toxin [Alphaproteobacteria bacterium]